MTQPETPWTGACDRRLARLLAGGEAGLYAGAELEVCHPDGSRAFRAALARHHRVDPPDLVWVRPVVGGYQPDAAEPGEPGYAFELDVARRRGLHVTAAWDHGDELGMDLATGQTAVIRPAAADTLAELRRWDTWYYTSLDAATQRELDALAHDA